MARLQEFYNETVRAQLVEKFSYKNPMQVPRIEKITLNTGAVSYTHLTLPTKA